MSIPRILALLSVFLFGTILVVSFFKKDKETLQQEQVHLNQPIEIEIAEEVEPIQEMAEPEVIEEAEVEIISLEEPRSSAESQMVLSEDLPDADRISEFFSKSENRLPIVETVVYKSRVPWHKGKAAWVSDYASHYKTSRHFIARSLNGKPDYEKQDVKEGDKFNVLRTDKDFEFYLVVDILTNKMWFYYLDHDSNDRVLLKTYPVSVGRPDTSKASGYLTPTGKYSLGSKIGIYKPAMKGTHKGEKIEMVRVFGTRWLPFGEEIADTTEPAKDLGIHGLPMLPKSNGDLAENLDNLGKYESDGCIRMATKDVEELFSIVITRPTTVEIVKGFYNAKLPGVEKKIARG